MRVLVVDDNIDLLETTGMLIELYGHEVRTCSDPLCAVDIATDFRPDIALLDIGMPNLDGYELCRQLRAVPSLAGLKIVAQSGYGDVHNKALARQAGFDTHLLKPVAANDLEQLLAERQAELGPS